MNLINTKTRSATNQLGLSLRQYTHNNSYYITALLNFKDK